MIDILLGDCIERMRGIPAGSVRTCVTSPPYFGLRDYGVDGQIGLEATPDAFIAKMVEVFREVRRVLSDDGTLWLNLGDSYTGGKQGRDDGGRSSDTFADNPYHDEVKPKQRPVPHGYKSKDLLGIPWRVALALQADGWYLRSDIIWAKPNPMPESVRDRPTKAHEYVFLLAKSARYYYDAEAVREEATTPPGSNGNFGNKNAEARCVASLTGNMAPGVEYRTGTHRNARSVWTITPRPFRGAHFATFPLELPTRCIKAGASERGKCPECGAAWVRVVESERPTKTDRTEAYAVASGVGGSPQPFTRRTPATTTTGWRPTCDHAHEPIPDTVLDPFAGAGTTAIAALKLGRSFVGCELNPAYREMALARIAKETERHPLLEGVA